MKAQDIPLLSTLFNKGYYTDFTTEWYMLTGDIIIETMLFNAIFPTLIQLFNGLLRFLKRKKDGYGAGPSGTKHTS